MKLRVNLMLKDGALTEIFEHEYSVGEALMLAETLSEATIILKGNTQFAVQYTSFIIEDGEMFLVSFAQEYTPEQPNLF